MDDGAYCSAFGVCKVLPADGGDLPVAIQDGVAYAGRGEAQEPVVARSGGVVQHRAHAVTECVAGRLLLAASNGAVEATPHTQAFGDGPQQPHERAPGYDFSGTLGPPGAGRE